MNDNANSPAYPTEFHTLHNCGIEQVSEYTLRMPGLTKRERFAMAAMQGLLADGETTVSRHHPEGQLVMTRLHGVPKLAVEYADALLAALED